MDIRETFEFVVTPPRAYTRTLACVARRTSLFLYIKARSGREGRGESPDGCRRWYPHPGENPSARNGGWLGAVVTLSSTGDAACGLHKQRLRHTHARARTRRGSVGGWGWMCNVATPRRCVRLVGLCHTYQQRGTPRSFAAS